jgi:hypothetical protein
MRTYIAFYQGQQATVSAESSYSAQLCAQGWFKAKNAWDISVFLADELVDPATL